MTSLRPFAFAAAAAAVVALLALNPLAVQASRCAAQAAYKDEQCHGAAWSAALGAAAWRDALRHPHRAVETHALTVDVARYAVERTLGSKDACP